MNHQSLVSARLTPLRKLAVPLFPGQAIPKNKSVTSISVEGGFRSKTPFRELMETGTVMFRHCRAAATVANTKTRVDLNIVYCLCTS